ncbi:MAG: hypothetical protein AMR96_00630 [Candidatus Adiutrix intracellularis]|jgi:hypothetical protein|nr:MAG: hypothetical protein AMR96_00630 [Candidatus Adiutrix intracellularis]
MQNIYDKILGVYAGDVTSCITACILKFIRINTKFQDLFLCDLSIHINFQSYLVDTDSKTVFSYLICSLVKRVESLPLLATIAIYLRLRIDILDTSDGSTNIIGEFLNIAINLTKAKWTEQSFEIKKITPPQPEWPTPAQFDPIQLGFLSKSKHRLHPQSRYHTSLLRKNLTARA